MAPDRQATRKMPVSPLESPAQTPRVTRSEPSSSCNVLKEESSAGTWIFLDHDPIKAESDYGPGSLFEHDLFRKPVSTFRVML